MQRDLLAPPLKLEGAKVAIEWDAKSIGLKHYGKRMMPQPGLRADEWARDVSIVTLGYTIPDFAAAGDKVWQVQIVTLENELRGIIWVHSETGNVHFVTGAWGGSKGVTPDVGSK